MKQNIKIIGGLGYIGTALTDLYAGEAHSKDITVIDNRFFADRVSELRNKGIK